MPQRVLRKTQDTTHSQILSVASRLMKEVDDLDLDTIDGEFYWRCCRPDFVSAVLDARAQLPVKPPIFDEFSEYSFTDTTIIESILQEFHVRFNIPQYFALNHITKDAPIPMRPYAITDQDGLNPDVREQYDNLRVAITSPNMTGKDVERIVRDWYQPPNDYFSGSRFNPMTAPGIIGDVLDDADLYFNRPRVLIRVSFDLILETSPRTDPGPVGYFNPLERYVVAFGDVPPPYVEVAIGFPMPPRGILGDLYDTVVCRQNQWHRQLAGVVSRQSNEVAIRTWTVGLLMSRTVGKSMRFHDAMGAYQDTTQRVEVSQDKFQDNRKDLIERVREATEYIRARPMRSKKDKG